MLTTYKGQDLERVVLVIMPRAYSESLVNSGGVSKSIAVDRVIDSSMRHALPHHKIKFMVELFANI